MPEPEPAESITIIHLAATKKRATKEGYVRIALGLSRYCMLGTCREGSHFSCTSTSITDFCPWYLWR